MKFKFFNWNQNYPEDHTIIFVNAQADFVSYLILDDASSIPLGTSLWLVHQSIEKYLKALLVKSGKFSIDELRKSKYGHNLKILFDQYKIINYKSMVYGEEDYQIFVTEVDSNGKNTGIRYSGGININEPFTRLYIEICTILRFDYLGGEDFNKNRLGFEGRSETVKKIVISAYSKYSKRIFFEAFNKK